MQRLIPYDPFGVDTTAFDDLFRGFFRPVRTNAPSAATIRMDVSETKDGYAVQAEIPGAKKEDVHVTVEGNQVTISAEVKREVEAKEGNGDGNGNGVLRSERFFGSYVRSFTLPAELDEAQSKAKFENGVLELTLARKASAAAKRLTVQ